MLPFWCLLVIGAVTCAQFVIPPDDLIETIGYAGVPVRFKEVPSGICELDPDVKSFSGYADVEIDQHIFWWFFEARNGNPQDSPVTVWINGGPGSSSMTGLLAELGPCGIDYFGNVYNNPNSWTNNSNLLFIDQPSQVGFSYSQPVPAYEEDGKLTVVPSDDCPKDGSNSKTCGTYSNPNVAITANSTINAAPAFWKTLQGFMGAFPQYSHAGFNIATESYGGHYGPVFGAFIERQNDLAIPGTQKVDLRTLLVGNGWFDPMIQFQAFYNFTVSPGNTYDFFPFNASTESRVYDNLYGSGKCLDRLGNCKLTGINSVCAEADEYCMDNVEGLYHELLGRDVYDIREVDPDVFPYKFFLDYLNTPGVQKAIGAYTNFSSFSRTVNQAFSSTGDDAREVDTIEDIRFLLKRNITVALYAGDADFDCNWIGGEAVADAVEARGFSRAGYTHLETSDGIVHGQVKQAGRFSFTRIYESGHMVPFYQPLAALALFERATRGVDIASGALSADPSYVTKGSRKSAYREGTATMQWEPVAPNTTYDVATNKPGRPWSRYPAAEDKPADAEYWKLYHFENNELGEGSPLCL
ncbi:Alpha/Beta hydrolase protein [Truncatella angustata]|uniref:Carboxypeptidase n=1 Tax=Truncatella angustata TaxID=152316 RepID=A0A9P8UMM6_9PEZI|nr:Alpha/Beta hydrolase protein [Truncatella angustata]KAH6654879.1 Alpha/Beta hydrolase protein [Truncatella angustata]